MSFGRSLRLFFVGIVVIPLIVLAVLVLQVNRDSRVGQADARLAASLDAARALYDEALAAAPGEAKRIATDVGDELAASDRSALAAVAEREAGSGGIVAVTVTGPGGEELAAAGPADVLAIAESSVRTSSGGLIGTVRVAALEPDAFVRQVERLTTRQVALVADRGVLATSKELDGVDLPEVPGEAGVDIELPDTGDSRAAALALDGASPGARLLVFSPVEAGFAASEPLVAVALAAFFALAFLLIVLLLRSLQNRVGAMLEAARRIGEGHFDRPVPVEGNDEMAGLARELNRMSERLSAQMDELKRQREELDGSVRRIGEAFASGLDREALLGVVAETAVAACGAEGGRVVLRDHGQVLASAGSPEHLDAVLIPAGKQAWDTRGEGSSSLGDLHAISQSMLDRAAGDDVLCVMAVGRRGAPFSQQEREVLRYLIGQTATSIENIDLHERVSEQAFTDELTGIANRRQFDEWLHHEAARAERFGRELSLVMLDIDDFKRVNDEYGHLQGDGVLARIARILDEQLRDVDLAARYGGEEFVMALPETPREGAVALAERVRAVIEGTRVDGFEGDSAVGVTASFGVATLPEDGNDARALTAVADRSLYEAKRAGKNRVVTTGRSEALAPQGNRTGRRN